MFEVLNPNQQTIILNANSRISDSGLFSRQAIHLYRGAALNGRLRWMWSRLSGRSNLLLDLNSLLAKIKVRSSHYAGIQAVAINKIIGSEGRVSDFDSSFNPLNEKTSQRWMSVANARLNGTPLPAVELIQMGDVYFVRDGHHRISVAKALGEGAIDAQVTVWNTSGLLPWQISSRADRLGLQAI